MLTTHSVRRSAVCAALPLVLLAAGCSEGHGHSPEQLDEMIAQDARESNEAEEGELPDSRFDPDALMCEPAVEGPEGWSTEVPRKAVDVGEDTVELVAHPPEETEVTGIVVTVVGPEEGTVTAGTEGEGPVTFPDDFEDAELVPGVHTVLWADQEGGNPLACDGFEAE